MFMFPLKSLARKGLIYFRKQTIYTVFINTKMVLVTEICPRKKQWPAYPE